MDDYKVFEYSKDASVNEENYETDAHRRGKKPLSSSPSKSGISDASGTTITKPKKGPPVITGIIETMEDIEDLEMLLK
jgi:hypothetical protein